MNNPIAGHEHDPAPVRHAKAVHAWLVANSVDGIFSGKLSDAYSACKVPQSTYSDVRALLLAGSTTNPASPTNGPAIEMVRAGTGKQGSIVKVNPTATENISAEHLTKPLARAKLATVVEEHEHRLQVLEAFRDNAFAKGELNIAEVLRNIEIRLRKLEASK